MSTTEPDDVTAKLQAAADALQSAVDAAIKDRDYRLATLLGPALSVVRRRVEERAAVPTSPEAP